MKSFVAHPLVTEKSMAKASESVYQFIVPTWATKRQVAEYIARHFNVTVLDVATATIQPKRVTFKRFPGIQSKAKKATVRLKSGQSITEFTLPADSGAATSPESAPTEVIDPKTESTITVRSKSKKAKA